MIKIKLNKLIYAVDALLGLVLILTSFFNVFRQGITIVDDLGNTTISYKWMNFFEYCNFSVSGISGVFMYAPMILVLICIVLLITLIFKKELKKYDNSIVILMFIAVIIMAIIQSFGYSYVFMIISYVVAGLLLISLLPLFVLDKKEEANIVKNSNNENVK